NGLLSLPMTSFLRAAKLSLAVGRWVPLDFSSRVASQRKVLWARAILPHLCSNLTQRLPSENCRAISLFTDLTSTAATTRSGVSSASSTSGGLPPGPGMGGPPPLPPPIGGMPPPPIGGFGPPPPPIGGIGRPSPPPPIGGRPMPPPPLSPSVGLLALRLITISR